MTDRLTESTAATRYRKRPVEVDAIRYTDATSADRIRTVHGDAVLDGDHLLIYTLEGQMRATIGDWIVRGVRGEVYPVKDSIFRETYETADAPKPPAGDRPRAVIEEALRLHTADLDREGHRAAVLREAADLIAARQERLEAEERADFGGDLDLETVQQGDAVRSMAAHLRRIADQAQQHVAATPTSKES